VLLDDELDVVDTGQTVTWTLDIDNPGVNSLSGVAVRATLPSTLQNASWTCLAASGGGSSCGAGGNGAPDDSATIAAGAHIVYLIVGTVAAEATGSITLAATATIPSGYENLSPDNDRATDTDRIFGDVIFRNGFDAQP
jgi:uncharacterized repeat protein (TIGR01451 family)